MSKVGWSELGQGSILDEIGADGGMDLGEPVRVAVERLSALATVALGEHLTCWRARGALLGALEIHRFPDGGRAVRRDVVGVGLEMAHL